VEKSRTHPRSVGKIRLKIAGNFVELGWDDADAPSLVEQRGKRGLEYKREVVEYLRSGTTFIVSPGIDEDVLDPTKSAGSASIATDGAWAWPKTLAYYVEAYDVALPPEFEAHMQRHRWKPADKIDKLGLELPP
jgi:hypothetical protein